MLKLVPQTQFTAEVLNLNGYKEHPHFSHAFIMEGKRTDSTAWDLILKPIWNDILKNNNINFTEFIRARISLTTKHPSKLPTAPHIDSPENHKVLIYYVNSSDGDTILYDQKFNNSPIDALTIKYKCTPEKGKFIIWITRCFTFLV
mgnify:CR=1 FL=1